MLVGLTGESTRADICQALLEGIALSTADVVNAMRSAVKLDGTISIDGGVSRSPYFAQFLADCLGQTVIARGFSERTALGVAQLAATALGVTIDAPTADDRSYIPSVSASIRERWQSVYTKARTRAQNWR